jgi:uncharacterized membrane protein YagU involved in acid resistance
MRCRSKIAAVIVGGAIVGVLDLTYAIVVYSPRAPILIPQTIASGILGAKAYQGGLATGALGVFLHFFIAFCVAAVYYVASRKLRVLVTAAVPAGMIYGGLVYCVMHGLVLPLSAVAHRPIPAVYVITEFVEHWFFVGLPVALSVRYFSRPRIARAT